MPNMETYSINEEFLSDILLVSNTPSYLFRRFRADPSVQWLGNHLSEIQLAAATSTFGNKPQKSFVDRVYAYAYLVAMSFKHAPAIRAAIHKHPLPVIEWGEELLQLVLSETFSETRTFVAFKITPDNLHLVRRDIPTTTGSISVVCSPVVETPRPVSAAKYMKKEIQIA